MMLYCFVSYRPEACPAIKLFAKAKGVEFMMMDKVDVNGLDAHPVYHYLKKVAGPVRDMKFGIKCPVSEHSSGLLTRILVLSPLSLV